MSTPGSTTFPRNSKRKRTESEDQEDMEELTKSSDYWFEDGNLVLQAKNTQFRVHRGVIARHSQVFCDMFGLPQPERECLVDGCPVVHVSDAPEDWTDLFSIFYDNNTLYKSTDEFALPLLASMLRLGKKYQIDSLHDEALERIRVELPSSLDRWDQMYSNDAEGLVNKSNSEISLVNVLEEMGIQSLLPVAYFICLCYLSPDQILDGWEGTTERFSFDSIKILISSHVKISTAVVNHQLTWGRSFSIFPTAQCATRIDCERDRFQLYEELLPGPQPGNALLSPDEFLGERFCDKCAEEAQRKYTAGRQHIWDKLPTYFGLPEWEDLKDA